MKTRVLVAARNRWERAFCARAVERLGEVGVARLLVLVAEGNEDGAALLALLCPSVTRARSAWTPC
ncbi:hypothetical protein [Streptomyces malaysiensis]|uniref:hypothetical protein n=1 Tax=Streptomyces malaysiensis TaxID=92644 RepID=UPI00342BFD33